MSAFGGWHCRRSAPILIALCVAVLVHRAFLLQSSCCRKIQAADPSADFDCLDLWGRGDSRLPRPRHGRWAPRPPRRRRRSRWRGSAASGRLAAVFIEEPFHPCGDRSGRRASRANSAGRTSPCCCSRLTSTSKAGEGRCRCRCRLQRCRSSAFGKCASYMRSCPLDRPAFLLMFDISFSTLCTWKHVCALGQGFQFETHQEDEVLSELSRRQHHLLSCCA